MMSCLGTEMYQFQTTDVEVLDFNKHKLKDARIHTLQVRNVHFWLTIKLNSGHVTKKNP